MEIDQKKDGLVADEEGGAMSGDDGCELRLRFHSNPSPSIEMSKRNNKSWRNSQPLKPAKLADPATIYAKLDSPSVQLAGCCLTRPRFAISRQAATCKSQHFRVSDINSGFFDMLLCTIK